MSKLTHEQLTEARELSRIALEQPITQESDLTGVLKVLNEDKLEPDSREHSIDLKTRLHPVELASIIVHDSIIALKCLPVDMLVTTRKKKRLAVSQLGKGREEMVDMVRAERQHKRPEAGFMSKLFGLGNKGEQ